MTIVRNRVRMDGFKRFRVGEYDDGDGLSKRVVIWPEIGDKCGGLALALIPVINSLISGGEW